LTDIPSVGVLKQSSADASALLAADIAAGTLASCTLIKGSESSAKSSRASS